MIGDNDSEPVFTILGNNSRGTGSYTSDAQLLQAANILASLITFLQFLVQKKIYEGFFIKPICICEKLHILVKENFPTKMKQCEGCVKRFI